jgi:hypothetical protein
VKAFFFLFLRGAVLLLVVGWEDGLLWLAWVVGGWDGRGRCVDLYGNIRLSSFLCGGECGVKLSLAAKVPMDRPDSPIKTNDKNKQTNNPHPHIHVSTHTHVQNKQQRHDLVVFHCMKSQVRGPFCAKRFAARLSMLDGDADDEEEEERGGKGGAGKKEEDQRGEEDGGTVAQRRPRVCVLRHGYEHWYYMYRKEIGMVVPCEAGDGDSDDDDEDEKD